MAHFHATRLQKCSHAVWLDIAKLRAVDAALGEELVGLHIATYRGAREENSQSCLSVRGDELGSSAALPPRSNRSLLMTATRVGHAELASVRRFARATRRAGAHTHALMPSLFAGRGPNVVEEPGIWQVWTPGMPPIPSVHPLNRSCDEGFFWPDKPHRTNRTIRLPMCLIRDDWVSKTIRRWGGWPDCRLLLHMWATSGNGMPPARAGDIFLEYRRRI